MNRIARVDMPEHALLAKYLHGGSYADCYTIAVTGTITHAAFVQAFYTTWVFRLERWILRWAVARPSTDAEAAALATGASDAFAAWTVEARAEDQLLMCDFQGRTRSWLMVVAGDGMPSATTRLYFGSAVVPVPDRRSGQPRLGWIYRSLLGFHQLYSRVLLRAAVRRLRATPARDRPRG